MSLLKPAILGLGLVAAIALSAHAQAVSGVAVPGPSIASLPPTDEGPRPSSHNSIPGVANSTITQSPKYMGPDPGRGWYAQEQQTHPVEPSPAYPGPRPN
ncbi:MAG TPA: hypothetical protein VKQ73_03210 [Stellaceae bacterium]|nr:hypothetical protein [Stellaceae bacterium]